MKYRDRHDKFLQEAFSTEHLKPHRDDAEVRAAKRVWKKARTKYLRRKGKEDIRDNDENQ